VSGNSVLPLGFLQTGRDAVVSDLAGGRSLRQRLTDMGVVRGTRVKVVKNDMGGPLIISIGEGRLAVGRGMALRIMVEVV
jgi:ferrous iron transport protein A